MEDSMRGAFLLVLCGAIAGCATSSYVPPDSAAKPASVVVIDKPRSLVWDSAVPRLAKAFFVVNNLDRSSGLINVSYSGAPDRYLDCGRIVVDDSVRGKTEFAGSQARVRYEATAFPYPVIVDRSLDLDGRMNIIFEELGADRTRVTVSARYVLTRRVTQTRGDGQSSSRTDTASLSSGGSTQIVGAPGVSPVTCIATGQLEREILDLVAQ
jgi:hypothetical protein